MRQPLHIMPAMFIGVMALLVLGLLLLGVWLTPRPAALPAIKYLNAGSFTVGTYEMEHFMFMNSGHKFLFVGGDPGVAVLHHPDCDCLNVVVNPELEVSP